MTSISRHPRRLCTAGLAAAAFLLISGCASTAVDTQWSDAQLPRGLLRGATVLVACEASDVAIQRNCQDRLMAGLAARGARPVAMPGNVGVPLAQSVIAPAVLQAARDAGARAVFGVTVGVASQSVNPGLSIGIGGFGFGNHLGGGIGVSAPIGGGTVSTGFSANGRVTEVASARLLWTARASTPPSSNLDSQLSELASTLLGAADKAGMF